MSHSQLTPDDADRSAATYYMAYKLFCAPYAANHTGFCDVMLDYMAHRF
jgi:hypothetical protein